MEDIAILCITRRCGDGFKIGDDIHVTVVAIYRESIIVKIQGSNWVENAQINYNEGYPVRSGIVVRYNGLRHGNRSIAIIGIEAPRNVPICRDDAINTSPEVDPVMSL